MKFKDFNSIPIAENITKDDFIQKIKSYSTIDDALLGLPDEYIEYYMINMNSLNKELKKLKKLNLQEEEKTLGYAPAPKKIIKQIKYKGQYITVEYDPELQSWFPAIRFRSIMTALKYIKKQVNYSEKDI